MTDRMPKAFGPGSDSFHYAATRDDDPRCKSEIEVDYVSAIGSETIRKLSHPCHCHDKCATLHAESAQPAANRCLAAPWSPPLSPPDRGSSFSTSRSSPSQIVNFFCYSRSSVITPRANSQFANPTSCKVKQNPKPRLPLSRYLTSDGLRSPILFPSPAKLSPLILLLNPP